MSLPQKKTNNYFIPAIVISDTSVAPTRKTSFLDYHQNLAQKQVDQLLFTIDLLRSGLFSLVDVAGRVSAMVKVLMCFIFMKLLISFVISFLNKIM